MLLRVLAGLVRPSAGHFSLAGVHQADDTAEGWARRVGYVAPQPAIYPWLSAQEALALAARLAGLTTGETALRVTDALDRLGLADRARVPLSRAGPMVAQKTALAAALLADPEVLLLDEPLRSLDPDQRAALLTLEPRRTTVVIASRYPASEEGIVNQVALIRDGLGIVNQVAYLRDGRVALHAKVSELRAHDLPLSARGIEALAERHGPPAAST